MAALRPQLESCAEEEGRTIGESTRDSRSLSHLAVQSSVTVQSVHAPLRATEENGSCHARSDRAVAELERCS